MGKNLDSALDRLARAHGEAGQGFGDFMTTLHKLEEIERRLDRALREQIEALEPFADPRSFMRRQAN